MAVKNSLTAGTEAEKSKVLMGQHLDRSVAVRWHSSPNSAVGRTGPYPNALSCVSLARATSGPPLPLLPMRVRANLSQKWLWGSVREP